MNRELTIIIPTKDRGAIFQETIDSVLLAAEGKNVHILIVNDSPVPLALSFSHPNVKVCRNKGIGAASARNYGAGLAKTELLLFLDDDILITKAALDNILDYSTKFNSSILIPNWTYPGVLEKRLKDTLFGRFMLANRLNSLKGWINDAGWTDENIMEVRNGASFCLLIRKSHFKSVNGYDEKFPYAGAEDYDFCRRLIEAGFRFFIDPNTVVYHNEADRIELKKWLERKKRDSATKKVAARLGYTEFTLHYGYFKSFVLAGLYLMNPVILFIAHIIPNRRSMDSLYSKIVLLLCASYIYKGYTSEK